MKKYLLVLFFFCTSLAFAQTEISHFEYGEVDSTKQHLSIHTTTGSLNLVLYSGLNYHLGSDPKLYLNSVSDSTEILPKVHGKYISDSRALKNGDLELLLIDENNTLFYLRTQSRYTLEVIDTIALSVGWRSSEALPLAKFHQDDMLYVSDSKIYSRNSRKALVTIPKTKPYGFSNSSNHYAFLFEDGIVLDNTYHPVKTSSFTSIFFEEDTLFAANNYMYRFDAAQNSFSIVNQTMRAHGSRLYYSLQRGSDILHEYYDINSNPLQIIDSSTFYKAQTILAKDLTIHTVAIVGTSASLGYSHISAKLRIEPGNHPPFTAFLGNRLLNFNTQVIHQQGNNVLLELNFSDFQKNWALINVSDSSKTVFFQPIRQLTSTHYYVQQISGADIHHYQILNTAELTYTGIRTEYLKNSLGDYPLNLWIQAYPFYVEVGDISKLKNEEKFLKNNRSVSLPLDASLTTPHLVKNIYLGNKNVQKVITRIESKEVTIKDIDTGVETSLSLPTLSENNEYQAYFPNDNLVLLPTIDGLYSYNFATKKLQQETKEFKVHVDAIEKKIVVLHSNYFKKDLECAVVHSSSTTLTFKKHRLGDFNGQVLGFKNGLLHYIDHSSEYLAELTESDTFRPLDKFWKGSSLHFGKVNDEILVFTHDNILYSSKAYPVHSPVFLGYGASYATKEDLYFPDMNTTLRYNISTRKFFILDETPAMHKYRGTQKYSFLIYANDNIYINYFDNGELKQYVAPKPSGTYDYSVLSDGPHQGVYLIGRLGTADPQVYHLDKGSYRIKWREISQLADEIPIDRAFSIKIYPNPAYDFLHLEAPGIIDKIEIYDLSGKKISEGGKTKRINIKDLPASTYILKVESGLKQSFNRFIKIK